MLAKKVTAAGINSVSGSVIVDASLFPEGDRELGTGVVISPIIVNDNLVDVTIGRGVRRERAASLAVSPSTSVRALHQQGGDRAGRNAAVDSVVIRFAHDRREPHRGRRAACFHKGRSRSSTAMPSPEPSRYAEVTLRRGAARGGRGRASRGPTQRSRRSCGSGHCTDRPTRWRSTSRRR